MVGQDQQTREDMKREKRRIQDQLRRLRRQEEKGVKKKTKTQKPKPLTTINVSSSNPSAMYCTYVQLLSMEKDLQCCRHGYYK